MVGFSGVMKALYESGVLDCATYVAGLSGSTWSVKVECLVFFFKTDVKIPRGFSQHCHSRTILGSFKNLSVNSSQKNSLFS